VHVAWHRAFLSVGADKPGYEPRALRNVERRQMLSALSQRFPVKPLQFRIHRCLMGRCGLRAPVTPKSPHSAGSEHRLAVRGRLQSIYISAMLFVLGRAKEARHESAAVPAGAGP